MTKSVAITGALGFIGSHTAKVFKEHGWHVIGIDRAVTISSASHFVDQLFLDDFARITGSAAVVSSADAIIHCAGTSLVGPSISNPAEYYNNNCSKTNLLVEKLGQYKWNGTFVFSSSAATYGIPKHNRLIVESDPQDPISPYGWSKLFCEHIIKDGCYAYDFKGVALRYFNACGADADGRLGHVEDDTHMIPRVLSAYHNNKPFTLYGDDYNTPDGTCIRDYLHVTDIALAHLEAVTLGEKMQRREFRAYNLGTGQGHSNLEVIHACNHAVGDVIGYQIGPRRIGDPDSLVADSALFQKDTNWRPINSSIENIVATAWHWQQRYPKSI